MGNAWLMDGKLQMISAALTPTVPTGFVSYKHAASVGKMISQLDTTNV